MGDRELARRWLQDESPNWFAALQAAAADGADHSVLEVADAMHWYSDLVPFWNHWFEVFDLARQAAHRLGDDALEATHTNYLVWVESLGRSNPQGALEYARRAGDLARRADDAVQLAWAETYAAAALDRLGRGELSLAAAENAVAAFERAGDRVGALQALVGTAKSLHVVGRSDDAVARVAEVLRRLDADAADLPLAMVAHTRATLLWIAGDALAAVRRFPDAEASLQAAITAWADGGFEAQQARTGVSLAEMLVQAGDPARAADVATHARDLAEAHHAPTTAVRARAVLAALVP